MKSDMDLARRIRGDRFWDYRDQQPKSGHEVFYMLPYSDEKEKMQQLRTQIAKEK